MEENWYAVQQQAHDRITEARALAHARALIREGALPHPGRYAVGIGLIRLGTWILAKSVTLPNEFSRALATLRAASARSLRA